MVHSCIDDAGLGYGDPDDADLSYLDPRYAGIDPSQDIMMPNSFDIYNVYQSPHFDALSSPTPSVLAPTPPPPAFKFRVPRVVQDQKNKFEKDKLFRQLRRENGVKYAGCEGSSMEKRRVKFKKACEDGKIEIACKATGTHMYLAISNSPGGGPHYPQSLPNKSANATGGEIDFLKESGRVHLRAHFILNGVCVFWHGWLDLETLEGLGRLEFDAEQAKIEDALLRE